MGWTLLILLLAPLAIYLLPMLMRQWMVLRLRAKCVRKGALVLTFDDGPSPETTSLLLELLEAAGASATFYMLGNKAQRHPELVRHVIDAGHEIGSHSQTHLHPWKKLPGAVLKDTQAGHEQLVAKTSSPISFRPPYGKITLYTWIWARLRGASLGWWTLDSGDTKTPMPGPSEPARAIALARGGVVLLHDLDRSPERNAFVLAATQELLDMARAEGLQILSLSQLSKLPH